jgi:hypothetical protein
MNKEQQELLDEANENYWSNAKHNNLDCLVKQEEGSFLVEMRFYYKEEFINKCKTDTEFSERWGLKIEERNLSLEERMELSPNIIETITRIDLINYIEDNGKSYNMTRMLDDKNIPTKLITITYNDKTIESYE